MIETRPAHADELARCADVLAEAFADSPWTRWTVDPTDHVDRVRALQLMSLQRLSMPYGQVWCTLSDGVVDCVAAWMDSATPVPPSVIDALADEVAAHEGTRHPASLAAASSGVDTAPAGRSFHLGVVGTTPSQQRRGLAGRTLAPVLAEADALGLPCTLETSTVSNVAFYERFGFRTAAQWVVPHGGPPVWAMSRPARGRFTPGRTSTASGRLAGG